MTDHNIKVEHHVFKVEGPVADVVEVYTKHFLRQFATPKDLTTLPSHVSIERPEKVEMVEIPGLHNFVRRYSIGKFTAKTLVLAYYLDIHEGKVFFDTSELKRLYDILGTRRPVNLWDTVMKLAKRGLLQRTGNYRGNRVELTLTDKGKHYVEVSLKRTR